jgi:Arc/MetJ-type ribon-helix-helix transcriptional regulator
MASDASAEEMVTFRLAPRDRAAIQRLIEKGEFRNRSDFLRYAVKSTLAHYEERHEPKLDLELDQVDLPSAPQAQRKATRRSNKGVNL